MIVVDCAAVVDTLTLVDGSEELRATLAANQLNAPALLDVEFVAALRGLTLRGSLAVDRALDALSDFDDLPIRRWASGVALRRRAFQLRDNVSAYDAAYVVLAEALDCPLVTRDLRLARGCAHLVEVVVR